MLLPSFGQSQNQTWAVKYRPNYEDFAKADLGHCHVYVQLDGNIRLNVYDPSFNLNVKGYSGGTIQNIELAPAGKTMGIKFQDWIPYHTEDTEKAPIDERHGPDLFWQSCGKDLPSLPADVLSAFKGWHDLPNKQ